MNRILSIWVNLITGLSRVGERLVLECACMPISNKDHSFDQGVVYTGDLRLCYT